MSKPYDATTKYLIDSGPADWLRLAGVSLPDETLVTPTESELSTVTASADRLLRVESANPCLYHLELQAGPDSSFDERVLWYNILARFEYKLPVRSIAFLLRKAADSPRVHG